MVFCRFDLIFYNIGDEQNETERKINQYEQVRMFKMRKSHFMLV